jgi:hypothetical protein
MLDRVISANGKEIIVSQDLSLSHAGTVWDGGIVPDCVSEQNPEIANKFITARECYS